MSQFEAVLYAAVLLPIERLEPGMPEATSAILDELVASSGEFPLTSDFVGRSSGIDIICFDDPSRFPEFADRWRRPRSIRDYKFLRLAVSQTLDLAELRRESSASGDGAAGDDREIAFYAEANLESALAKAFGDIVVAAHIARPGSLEVDAVYSVDGWRRVIPEFRTVLPFAVEEARELQWPTIESLRLRDVWDWLVSIPGLKRGVPELPAGRAVAALSHLISSGSRSRSVEDLVWALVGLESLYAKGNTGLISQLAEKTEVVLGKRKIDKKRFTRMYDFRSRFVHGDTSFPLAYSPYDAVEEFEKYSEAAYDSSLLAMATLVASLQDLVKRNAYQFTFVYAFADTIEEGA